MRPTDYLRWPRRDRALVEGYLEYRARILDHGQPDWEATDIAYDGCYEVAVDIDYAKQAIEEFRKDHKPIPGERLRVVRVSDPEPDDPPPTPQAPDDEALA